MSSRPQRRRQRDEKRPIVGRTELVTAAVVVLTAGVTLGLVLLLGSRGDDGGGDDAAGVTSTPFEPADADGQAIVELGRRSVEALPQGQWASLYDAFTQEFRDRCAREDFVASGAADASNLGDTLPLIHFKYLIDVSISGETATATIVGEAQGEYTIQTAYAREGGEWKIAPAPGTSGCSGFNRLSG
jgi:hypothetical protein